MATRRTTKTAVTARQLGFDELVQAFIDDARHHGRGDSVANYYARRLQLLCEGLQCAFIARPLRRDDEDDYRDAAARDRNDVRSLARDCLRNHSALYAPFSVGLEGRPGPLEQFVRDRNAGALTASVEALKAALQGCFADCLRALEPKLVERTVAESWLFERGLPRTPPDLDDW